MAITIISDVTTGTQRVIEWSNGSITVLCAGPVPTVKVIPLSLVLSRMTEAEFDSLEDLAQTNATARKLLRYMQMLNAVPIEMPRIVNGFDTLYGQPRREELLAVD